MSRGKVWLIGAGPSDSELLTIKARKVLEKAEVIVYDSLIGDSTTAMIEGGLLGRGAELVYVGKHAGDHAMRQEDINRLLLDRALAGKKVVRLKGGDPFLFGRGGEELELLAENQVDFEVVPGVTSPLAAPAYCGIPVTHRDMAYQLHIVTARRKAGEREPIDFPALARLKDTTIVFMMGVGEIENICRGLIGAGMDENTPAAILEKAATAGQRRIVSDLANLPKKAREAKVGRPGIILVGQVCKLAEKFHWAEDRPLGGCRVIITRPRGRTSRLYDKLADLGAEVIPVPAIETIPMEIGDGWQGADWLVFTSKTGVEAFFAMLQKKRIDVRSLAGVKFAAVGKATADLMEEKGIFADYLPKAYCGEALGQGLPLAEGQKIALFAPKGVESSCARSLRERGADISIIEAYETKPIGGKPLAVKQGDMAVFTSGSSVRGFAERADRTEGVPAFCIGQQTGAEAEKYGMDVKIAQKATIDSLVEAVIQARKAEKNGN